MGFLLAHCGSSFAGNGFLFSTFFFAGLTGGFTHCVTMCGYFLTCQTMCGSGGCGAKKTLMGSLSLKYHLGRATTYGILGFVSAFLSKQIAYSPIWPWLSASMLVIAGIMFIASSIRADCSHESSGVTKGYIRGVLLGFIPCSLLYAALMMAATTANPFKAMLAMWLFVLGTVPGLLIANFGVGLITKKWQELIQRVGKALMAFNGFWLFVMAIKLVR